MMVRFVEPGFHTHSTSISVPVRPAKVTDRGSPARNSGRLLTQPTKSVGNGINGSASVGPATFTSARALMTRSVSLRYRSSTYPFETGTVSGTQPSDRVSVRGTLKALASKTTGACEATGFGEATAAAVGCGPPTAGPFGSRL